MTNDALYTFADAQTDKHTKTPTVPIASTAKLIIRIRTTVEPRREEKVVSENIFMVLFKDL